MDGVLVINKEAGKTSRDMVNQVSDILGVKKIGHTGTLDPLATGVLVLCVGKATKIVEVLMGDQKEYLATAVLGVQTDTLDVTGTLLKRQPASFTKEQIEATLQSFPKIYEQEPPLFSAIRKHGQRLYEYARNGEDVDIPLRSVAIYELRLEGEPKREQDQTIFQFWATVSKGTYIRSLIRDLALSLDTIGTMSHLMRTKQGIFTIEQAYTLKDIEMGNFTLLSIDSVLSSKYSTITVEDPKVIFQIENGALLKREMTAEVLYYRSSDGKPLALYRPYPKDFSLLKPWKVF